MCFILLSHKNTNILRLNQKEQAFIEQLLFKMLAENNNPKNSSPIYLKIMLTEFLIFAGRLFQSTPSYVSEHSNSEFESDSDGRLSKFRGTEKRRNLNFCRNQF